MSLLAKESSRRSGQVGLDLEQGEEPEKFAVPCWMAPFAIRTATSVSR